MLFRRSTTLPPAVVRLPAEIDLTNAARVGDELLAAFRPGVSVVIADMTWTTLCEASGIRSLVRADEQASASHAELRVAVRSDLLLRVLQLLGADTVLQIYPSLDAALAAWPKVPCGAAPAPGG
jgi:anti-sigma B factor antagonist